MNTQNGCNSAMTVKESSAKDERISDVRFDMQVIDSQYLRPMRMHFRRKDKQFTWFSI
jgi:hypothetical protein